MELGLFKQLSKGDGVMQKERNVGRKKVDTHQQNSLREILNINYPKKIPNEVLYTNEVLYL